MPEPNNTSGEAPRDVILDHSYDGIQEYDNPLPGWWKAIFLASIAFALPYAAWYHFMDGNGIYDQYAADVAAQAAREAAQP